MVKVSVHARRATATVVEGGWWVELSHTDMAEGSVIARYACDNWAITEHVMREWLVYGKVYEHTVETPTHFERKPLEDEREFLEENED